MKFSQFINIAALTSLAVVSKAQSLRAALRNNDMDASPETWVSPDIARNQNVHVSSTYRNWELYKAENLVDGISGTRWTSEYSDNQTIDIDLGDTFLIDRVRLNWEAAHANTYELQLSSDGNSWTTVESADNSEGGFEEVTFESHEAQYVKLHLLTRATRYGFSLWDFEVYKAQNATGEAVSEPSVGLPEPSTPDLAKNSMVHASSTYRNWELYNVENMIDGNNGTRWASERSRNNQKIDVDLGEIHDINRIRIGWEEAHAQSYELWVSADGDDWTTIYSTENCQGGLEDIAFESQSGRYIHMNLLTMATEHGFSIWDFEVYETE